MSELATLHCGQNHATLKTKSFLALLQQFTLSPAASSTN
jgi:hypothetical protein